MDHSLLINSFTDGHLDCFQYLAIVNCAAMNIGVHKFFWIGVSGELLPFLTAWMEVENILLTEISQLVKDKYHMISPIRGI